MLKMQPQSIIFNSADCYRVLFEDKKEEYTFSVRWTGEIGVLNCDQHEFYFDTHDDPAAKLLLKAIDAFDEARRKSTVKLVMAVEHQTGEPDNKYKVRFQTETGEIECGVTIEDAGLGDGILILVGNSDFLDITEGDPTADRLRESIFALHQARHFKYAETANPKTEIRSTQSPADGAKRSRS